MEIYSVGGAVRDRLLGLPVSDRDFVVVGASPEEMQALGYTAVGRDFPVFLHPATHEEYALARTERKTGPGYKGFAFHAHPSVSLEEDLQRRDLTINAMAEDAQGHIIDPFGGLQDLKARVLRHVGPAFVEDPVRILRVARFAARFTDFSIAKETLELMRQMVLAGEVDALVSERVWQECARGLMEARPSRMFQVLAECGALARIAPELSELAAPAFVALDRSAQRGRSLAVRCAVWLAEAGLDLAAIHSLAGRLRMPTDCSELALLTARERPVLPSLACPGPAVLLEFLERADALRRFERLEQMFLAQTDLAGESLTQTWRLVSEAVQTLRDIDAAAIALKTAKAEIPLAIRRARLDALARLLG